MDQEKIGKFILQLRKENNMTQKELANYLHVYDTTISKWERGINIPDVSLLKEIADLFHVTEHELLQGERNFKKREIRKQKKVLEVSNLSFKIGKKEILKDISFTIYAGEIVGLIGVNGAGKTTLMKTILDLYHKDSGQIHICDFDIKKELEYALSQTGSMIEEPDLYENLTGLKNLEVIYHLYHMKDKKRIDEVVKLVGLEDRIHDKVKKYSLGMKERLAFACALLCRPKLLLLDEPMNGLDPYGIKDLRCMLKKMCEEENIGILISSHILPEIENICDRILIMQDGKIIRDFGIEEVKYKNINLEDEFFREIKGDKNDESNQM